MRKTRPKSLERKKERQTDSQPDKDTETERGICIYEWKISFWHKTRWNKCHTMNLLFKNAVRIITGVTILSHSRDLAEQMWWRYKTCTMQDIGKITTYLLVKHIKGGKTRKTNKRYTKGKLKALNMKKFINGWKSKWSTGYAI